MAPAPSLGSGVSWISTSAPLRVAVVADHLLVAQAVRAALAAEGWEAHTLDWRSHGAGDRMARQLSRMRPDVGLVVLDAVLSPVLAQVQWLLDQHPVRWVAVTGTEPDATWGALLEAGARMVLPAGVGLEVIEDTLAKVALGRGSMPASERERALNRWHQVSLPRRALLARMRTLTPREHAVLELLVAGRSVRAIAGDSAVAETTVRSQIKAVLRKLEVSSQLRAVAAVQTLRDGAA
jgi:DNA-binding NarL/FixJ family response regulator